MKQRISFIEIDENQPALRKSLLDLSKSLESTTLEKKLIHLIKFRASQINGCGFCLHMHGNEARKDGEDTQRLDMLSSWFESPHYTERERLALQLCETLTRLPGSKIDNEQYSQLTGTFSKKEIIDLLSVIITINSWNRVVALSHMIPNLSN